MSRWFRMYDELLDNPKVQRLSGDEFKAWVNILCLASRNNGVVPNVADIAFALRLDAKKANKIVASLIDAGLLEAGDDGRFTPHKWNERQYKSDVSTGRVKRFRQRSKKQDETEVETAPDTETDTETDSVGKPTAADAPSIDIDKIAFDQGIAFLGTTGMAPTKARTLIGKWKRDHGAGRVIEAIGAAQRQGIIDPVPWIEARWNAANDVIGRQRAEAPC